MRRREVLEDAARNGHGEMGVHIGEARHDHLVRAVDAFGVRIAGKNLFSGSDCRDALAVDRNRGVIVHRIIVVDGDDGGIMNDSDQELPHNNGTMVAIFQPRRRSILQAAVALPAVTIFQAPARAATLPGADWEKVAPQAAGFNAPGIEALELKLVTLPTTSFMIVS